MKPDWNDAPEWANWLAGDTYGFVWSEKEPDLVGEMWCDDETGEFLSFGQEDIERNVFKEPRP